MQEVLTVKYFDLHVTLRHCCASGMSWIRYFTNFSSLEHLFRSSTRFPQVHPLCITTFLVVLAFKFFQSFYTPGVVRVIVKAFFTLYHSLRFVIFIWLLQVLAQIWIISLFFKKIASLYSENNCTAGFQGDDAHTCWRQWVVDGDGCPRTRGVGIAVLGVWFHFSGVKNVNTESPTDFGDFVGHIFCF